MSEELKEQLDALQLPQVVEPTNELTAKKKRKITDKEAENALLDLQVDANFSVLKQKAKEVFGDWQAEQGVGQILMTTNFYTLSQVERACKMGIAIMNDHTNPDEPSIEAEVKIKAGLMVVQAAKAATEMSKTLMDLAQKCGALVEKQKFKHAPPNLLIEASGDVHVHESGEKSE